MEQTPSRGDIADAWKYPDDRPVSMKMFREAVSLWDPESFTAIPENIEKLVAIFYHPNTGEWHNKEELEMDLMGKMERGLTAALGLHG
jgi:hypothetical protein